MNEATQARAASAGPYAAPRPLDFVPFDAAQLDRPLAWHFEQQVCKQPDHLALQAGALRMTYAELNRAANRLAHFILRTPGTAEAPVALLLPPGAEALTAEGRCDGHEDVAVGAVVVEEDSAGGGDLVFEFEDVGGAFVEVGGGDGWGVVWRGGAEGGAV